MAARLDDHYELVAGALSSSPEKAELSARELGLDPSRSYGSFKEMAIREAKLKNGIEAEMRERLSPELTVERVLDA